MIRILTLALLACCFTTAARATDVIDVSVPRWSPPIMVAEDLPHGVPVPAQAPAMDKSTPAQVIIVAPTRKPNSVFQPIDQATKDRLEKIDEADAARKKAAELQK